MRALVILISLCLVSSLSTTVVAAPASWIKLTDRSRPHCDKQAPCALTQEKSKKRFQITFAKTQEKNKLWLESVSIQTDASKPIVYPLENVQALYPNELYGLYAIDLNEDGWMDLALEGSLSNRMGPTYYYWLFDAKKQMFVLTNEQLEELQPSGKALWRGVASGDSYKLSVELQIESAATTRKEPVTQ